MKYGFIKVASAIPAVKVGDVIFNTQQIEEQIALAEGKGVEIITFPELSVTGYSCQDLFRQQMLLESSEQAVMMLLDFTRKLDIISIVGAPVIAGDLLLNCGIVIQHGQILGIVPKTYLPNYSEFYEKRWFTSADKRLSDEITLNYVANRPTVPFSPNIIIKDLRGAIVGTEICEDLWVSAPPSGELCKAGANIIINPSASNDVIGKREYRRSLVAMQSGRCRAGYVYASSGAGESSTDLVFSGHCIIADNGRIAGETSDYSKTYE